MLNHHRFMPSTPTPTPMSRVGAVNASVGSRREPVANSVHTADATQLDS